MHALIHSFIHEMLAPTQTHQEYFIVCVCVCVSLHVWVSQGIPSLIAASLAAEGVSATCPTGTSTP